MESIELLKDNFLGISHENQMILLDTFINTINENQMIKILKEFNDAFLDYYEKINNLSLFKKSYKDINSDKRRLLRKIVLEQLKNQVEFHHTNYSDENRSQQFLNSSDEVLEKCKLAEYDRYFKPSNVSEDTVQQILEDYSKLTIDKKRELIEDMSLYYDRLNYFSMPLPQETLQEFRPIIQNLMGDELMEYYDSLYTEERMEFIINVVDYFENIVCNIEYYNKITSEMKEDPKYIQNLKAQTIRFCRFHV